MDMNNNNGNKTLIVIRKIWDQDISHVEVFKDYVFKIKTTFPSS